MISKRIFDNIFKRAGAHFFFKVNWFYTRSNYLTLLFLTIQLGINTQFKCQVVLFDPQI